MVQEPDLDIFENNRKVFEALRRNAIEEGCTIIPKKVDECLEKMVVFGDPNYCDRFLRDLYRAMEFAKRYAPSYSQLVLDRIMAVNADPELENYVFIKIDGYDYTGYAEDPNDAYYQCTSTIHESRERTQWQIEGKNSASRDLMCACLADFIAATFTRQGLPASIEAFPKDRIGYKVFVKWDAETLENAIKD